MADSHNFVLDKKDKVQSNIEGYTDKWIFLPTAGSRSFGKYMNNLIRVLMSIPVRCHVSTVCLSAPS